MKRSDGAGIFGGPLIYNFSVTGLNIFIISKYNFFKKIRSNACVHSNIFVRYLYVVVI